MLCKDCSQKFYITNIGVCKNCGSHTSSGAFSLCNPCSDKLDECKHCLKSTAADGDSATPSAK